jgi:DNA modification methylase
MRVHLQNGLQQILVGDCREILPTLPDESVQCCVTSPPYWNLRSYLPRGHPDKSLEIGQESTPQEYVETMRQVFEDVRRILKPDGTLWLNISDTYAANRGYQVADTKHVDVGNDMRSRVPIGLKPKDLVGIPWRVAFALQDDGWYLRSDIIWHKPNPMPESVTDRPTRSHEYIFLLSKSPRYYYDHEAIKDPPSPDLLKQIKDGYNGQAIKDYLGASVQDASATKLRIIQGYRKRIDKQRGHSRRHAGFNDKWDALTPEEQAMCGRNKRDVWTVAPANYRQAHFATFPPNLIRPCILAGTRPGDTVLDPFGGSGTTGEVAHLSGRKSILCELNEAYIPMIERRTEATGLAL